MSRTGRPTPSTRVREAEYEDALDRVFPRATLKPCPTVESVQQREAQPPVVAKEKRDYPQRVAVSRPPALTEREEKVRRILLKELGGLNTNTLGSAGLSYVERQRLEKTLDAAYLDAEIAKSRKILRGMDIVKPVALLASVVLVIVCGAMIAGGSTWWSALTTVLPLSPVLVVPFLQARSTQRRLFILEALRALSDADEMDVVLDRATLDADRLISEITQRALAAESESRR